MTYILICGSRDATPKMLQYARDCTARALEHGWFVLAGDAPGVDTAVAETVRDCFHHEDPLMFGGRVYGLAEQPRHGVVADCLSYHRVKRITERQIVYGSRGVCVYDHDLPVTYAERDKLMVREADKVLCIWNGRSQGTPAVHRYALVQGKEAWLRRDNG
jgi:hypothetical protein